VLEPLRPWAVKQPSTPSGRPEAQVSHAGGGRRAGARQVGGAGDGDDAGGVAREALAERQRLGGAGGAVHAAPAAQLARHRQHHGRVAPDERRAQLHQAHDGLQRRVAVSRVTGWAQAERRSQPARGPDSQVWLAAFAWRCPVSSQACSRKKRRHQYLGYSQALASNCRALWRAHLRTERRGARAHRVEHPRFVKSFCCTRGGAHTVDPLRAERAHVDKQRRGYLGKVCRLLPGVSLRVHSPLKASTHSTHAGALVHSAGTAMLCRTVTTS